MSTPLPVKQRRSRLGIALVLGGYVIPLLVAATLLFLLDDVVIGVALLCIEGLTVTGIHLALRAPSPHERPDRLPGEPVLGLPGDIPRGSTSRAVSQVAFAMVGVVVVLAVIAQIASHHG